MEPPFDGARRTLPVLRHLGFTQLQVITLDNHSALGRREGDQCVVQLLIGFDPLAQQRWVAAERSSSIGRGFKDMVGDLVERAVLFAPVCRRYRCIRNAAQKLRPKGALRVILGNAFVHSQKSALYDILGQRSIEGNQIGDTERLVLIGMHQCGEAMNITLFQALNSILFVHALLLSR
ncbi:MAG: hypothetical protein MI924_31915 [Chloroflexales bacterium]|nr:hypothetical protein [Chloroflexales bacterium]